MIFKRQPTTKTLLLFVALFAIVFAVLSQGKYPKDAIAILLGMFLARLMLAGFAALTIQRAWLVVPGWGITNEAILVVVYCVYGPHPDNNFLIWLFDPIVLLIEHRALSDILAFTIVLIAAGFAWGAASWMLSRSCRLREPVHPRRASLRFRMGLLIVLAVALSWRAYEIWWIAVRKEKLRTLGVRVSDFTAQPPWSEWFFGDDPPGYATTLLGPRREMTEASLVYIEALTRIEVLNLDYTGLTDTGLARLTGLKQVKTLHLCDTRITDAGLIYLRRFPHLRRLILGSSEITDTALAHIARLTELEGLFLNGTSVTDAGLAHLKSLTQLRQLSVFDTHVSDAGIDDLQEALPHLQIYR